MWWSEWPDLAAEIDKLERDECLSCRQLRQMVADLMLKNKSLQVAHTIEIGRMQEQLDNMRNEKRLAECICRREGFNTQHVGD